jgi:hypothetical protein
VLSGYRGKAVPRMRCVIYKKKIGVNKSDIITKKGCDINKSAKLQGA